MAEIYNVLGIIKSKDVTEAQFADLQAVLKTRTDNEAPVTKEQFQALVTFAGKHKDLFMDGKPLSIWNTVLNTDQGKTFIALLEKHNPIELYYDYALTHCMARHVNFACDILETLAANEAMDYASDIFTNHHNNIAMIATLFLDSRMRNKEIPGGAASIYFLIEFLAGEPDHTSIGMLEDALFCAMKNYNNNQHALIITILSNLDHIKPIATAIMAIPPFERLTQAFAGDLQYAGNYVLGQRKVINHFHHAETLRLAIDNHRQYALELGTSFEILHGGEMLRQLPFVELVIGNPSHAVKLANAVVKLEPGIMLVNNGAAYTNELIRLLAAYPDYLKPLTTLLLLPNHYKLSLTNNALLNLLNESVTNQFSPASITFLSQNGTLPALQQMACEPAQYILGVVYTGRLEIEGVNPDDTKAYKYFNMMTNRKSRWYLNAQENLIEILHSRVDQNINEPTAGSDQAKLRDRITETNQYLVDHGRTEFNDRLKRATGAGVTSMLRFVAPISAPENHVRDGNVATRSIGTQMPRPK